MNSLAAVITAGTTKLSTVSGGSASVARIAPRRSPEALDAASTQPRRSLDAGLLTADGTDDDLILCVWPGEWLRDEATQALSSRRG